MARYDSDNVRVFTLRDLVIFGFAFMAPTAPALLFSDAATMSGGALASSYFFALVFVMFTVNSFRKLTTTFPPAGSIYTHADTGTRRVIGFITDWSLMLLYIFAPISFIMLAANLAHSAIGAIPYFVWVLLLAAIAGLINLFGTRILALSNMAIVIICAAVSIIFFLVCVMGSLRGSGVGAIFSGIPFTGGKATDSSGGFHGILAGSGVAGIALLGFSVISGMSGEAENPKKNIGRAMFIATLAIGILFLLQAYGAGLIWPKVEMTPGANAAIEIAKRAGGPPMVFLYGFATIISSIAVAGAGIAAASRKLYAMGRKNVLPKRFFTNVNRTTRIPALNVILIFVLIFVLSLLFKDPSVPREIFEFGGAFVCILINLTVLIHFYFQRNGEGLASCLIFPVLGFFGGLYMWLNHLKPFLFGLVWLAIGLLLVTAVDFGIGGVFEKGRDGLLRITGKLPRNPARFGGGRDSREEKTEPRRPRLRINEYPENEAAAEEDYEGSILDHFKPNKAANAEPEDGGFGRPEPDFFAELDEREPYRDETDGGGQRAPVIEEVSVGAGAEDFGEPEPDVFSDFKKREVFTLDDIEGFGEAKTKPEFEADGDDEISVLDAIGGAEEIEEIELTEEIEVEDEDMEAVIPDPVFSTPEPVNRPGASRSAAARAATVKPDMDMEQEPAMPGRATQRGFFEQEAEEPPMPRHAARRPAVTEQDSLPSNARPKVEYFDEDDEEEDQDTFPLQWFVPGSEEESPEVPPVRGRKAERPAPEPAPTVTPGRSAANRAAAAPNRPPATPTSDRQMTGRPAAPATGRPATGSRPTAPPTAARPAATRSPLPTREAAPASEMERPAAAPQRTGRPPQPPQPSGASRAKSYTELFVHTHGGPVQGDENSFDLMNQWNVPPSNDADEEDYFDLD